MPFVGIDNQIVATVTIFLELALVRVFVLLSFKATLLLHLA